MNHQNMFAGLESCVLFASLFQLLALVTHNVCVLNALHIVMLLVAIANGLLE